MDLRLAYINELGTNFKRNKVYEFIFTNNINEVTGDDWLVTPANNKPTTPNIEYIKEVGIISNEVIFNVIQQSDYFGMNDAIDGVVALAWEVVSLEDTGIKRLVFHFGEPKESVVDKLYECDITLNFKTQLELIK